MNRYLFVIDYQNDFVDGALGTPEAAAIINNAANKIKNFDGKVTELEKEIPAPDHLQAQIKYPSIIFKNKNNTTTNNNTTNKNL